MAVGVTWDKRSPNDWLASNGKWYPSSSYPRGWETSALPPAPGEGGVGSILRKYAEKAAEATGLDLDFGDDAPSTAPPRPNPSRVTKTKTPRPTAAPPTGPRSSSGPLPDPPKMSKPPSGFSVMDPGRRRVADATVTNERDFAHKVGAGAPPPKQLSTPPPPGRVSSGPKPPPASPAPPTGSSVPAVQKPPPPKSAAVGGFDVIAGDFGKVLGGAKKRIEEALNDAYEGKQ